ncbi:hypothetical protein AB1Y20_000963 [Prymnesium parvum]|uniref:JmjC domain-containing protein n=1 Tax=Prymnesium parvum TaxID=97485 RepID=A0AB34KA82_PRYPA
MPSRLFIPSRPHRPPQLATRYGLGVLLLLLAASTHLVLASEPHDSPRALYANGLACLRRREPTGARGALLRLRELHPHSAYCALLEGHCYLMLEKDEHEAAAQYSQAERIAQDAVDVAEAKHAIGRLHRMCGRWDDASRSYREAHALLPDNPEFEQELLFAQAKVHLLVGQLKEATRTLERGIELADHAWKPHFTRELAHAAGLSGDYEAAAQYFEAARLLGGVPGHTAVAQALRALAAHHEASDVAVSAGFLCAATHAFAASLEESGAAHTSSAHAHLQLAETLEALHALGEAKSPLQPHCSAGCLADARCHYEQALTLNPQMVEAYDGLGRLLLGVSRLANFGAVHAAALNVDEAERLLATAASLDGPSYEPVGGSSVSAEQRAARREWRDAQLRFMAHTRTEVAEWKAIVESIREGASAVGAATTATDREEWALPDWLEGTAEIPRVAAPTTELELREIVKAGRPVVLVGLQQRAGFAPRDHWQASNLRQRFGNMTVKVSVSPTGRFDGPESGTAWQLPEESEVLVRPPETHMRLADYLSLLEVPTTESFYVEYNALHQYIGEELRQMAPVPSEAEWLRPLLCNLWLGKGATTSPLHYDEYENLLAQVEGTKELVLFPPSDLPYLYYTPRVKGTLQYVWPNTFTRLPISDKTKQTHVVFASSAKVTQPDFSKHPHLNLASPSRCTLNPGETLYLPAYWHHEVHSRRAKPHGLNVAVNFWFRNESRAPNGF